MHKVLRTVASHRKGCKLQCWEKSQKQQTVLLVSGLRWACPQSERAEILASSLVSLASQSGFSLPRKVGVAVMIDVHQLLLFHDPVVFQCRRDVAREQTLSPQSWPCSWDPEAQGGSDCPKVTSAELGEGVGCAASRTCRGPGQFPLGSPDFIRCMWPCASWVSRAIGILDSMCPWGLWRCRLCTAYPGSLPFRGAPLPS